MILLAPAPMRLERNFVERWLRAYFCVIERGEQNKGASLSHDLCRFCPNQGEACTGTEHLVGFLVLFGTLDVKYYRIKKLRF